MLIPYRFFTSENQNTKALTSTHKDYSNLKINATFNKFNTKALTNNKNNNSLMMNISPSSATLNIDKMFNY